MHTPSGKFSRSFGAAAQAAWRSSPPSDEPRLAGQPVGRRAALRFIAGGSAAERTQRRGWGGVGDDL